MQNRMRLPWFVLAPAVVVAASTAAIGAAYFAGPLFIQTCENEINLLTGELEQGCGDGGGSAAAVPTATPTNRPEMEEVVASAPTPTPTAEAPQPRASATEPTATATEPTPDALTRAPVPTSTPEPTAPPEGPGVVASGSFRDGAPGHHGSGTAEVQRLADGSLNLRLADFSVTNGPDLIVYLSPDADDYVAGGLSLGSLRANNGNQNYTIPAGTDLSQFRSVIIWCKSFPTVFAVATLEAQ